jgi:predicted nicotinamide N-methyase
VRSLTRVTQPALVPELQVRVAEALMPTWEATEKYAGHAVPPPFWAFLWPGSHALARLLLDEPQLIAGKRVFDFGSGCGLAAIAAARAGARHVIACDSDPLAAEAQQTNAELNGVAFRSVTSNPTHALLDEIDVVLAGDVCYERTLGREVGDWLRLLAEDGLEVLLADPGRAYAPSERLELLASYEVPTSRELESSDALHTSIWRISP